MTVRPKLDPELKALVVRTRAKLEANGERRTANGELRAATGLYESRFDAETREVIAEFVRSGEYHRLAIEVGREDPDFADL